MTALAARVSGLPAGPLLFPALADRRALGPAQPGPGAPQPLAGRPLPAAQPERGRARRAIHQMQRAPSVGCNGIGA